MTRLLVVLLLLPLLSHAQVVRPPARSVTVPVNTPGFNPGTPPEPVYTPEGAGASHGSLPGAITPPQAKVAPSPNKRILPESSEPGLWAADGAPRASGAANADLFGVHLPRGMWDPTSLDMQAVDSCVAQMLKAAYDSGMNDIINAYPADVRACFAASAYWSCAEGNATLARAEGSGASADVLAVVERVAQHAESVRSRYCRGVSIQKDQGDAFQRVVQQWTKWKTDRRPRPSR